VTENSFVFILISMETKICKIKNCGRKTVGQGLCNTHYMRKRKHGSTDKPKCRGEKLLERGMSYCAKCKKEKPICEFSKDKYRRINGVSVYCKKCASKINKLDYKLHEERFRNNDLKKKFGISLSKYNDLLNLQNGVCAICGKLNEYNRRLSVDHNHKTNEVRGILCDLCNRGLGVFKDDPMILSKAIKYLESPPVNKMSRLDKI